VTVPGSKSESNRALILAALADDPSKLTGVLWARDTELMINGLRALGHELDVTAPNAVGNVDIDVTPHMMTTSTTIDCGLAGTVMRFLPPLAALARGEITFTGDKEARQRPMATLIEALRDLGVRVHDGDTGRIPFILEGRGEVLGGEVTLDASRSSQFVSALLLSAARYESGITIHHVGPPVPSQPHIQMTIAMLAEHGVLVHTSDASVWHVDPHDVASVDRAIEPDLSNATPFLAAAVVTAGAVTIPGWPAHSLQPGNHFLDIVELMGAQVTRHGSGVRVLGSSSIQGIDIDLAAAGEITPTIAALAALAEGPSTLRGIGHLRGHETDRLDAISTELAALGANVTATEDSLHIVPGALHPRKMHTYADHRMATMAAIIGLRCPGIEIENIGTTAKTMPNFPKMWSALISGEPS
jgi:3-phosphoshikimate 1-carboxyvinyltransferase